MNYALRGEFPSLERLLQNIFYICITLPELIFPLINCFPVILFRLLEANICWNQSSHAMYVSLSFIILLAKVTVVSLK